MADEKPTALEAGGTGRTRRNRSRLVPLRRRGPADGDDRDSAGGGPATTSDVTACNICNGTDFGPGPGGRSAASGQAPQCRNCQSLERHRALRAVYTHLTGALRQEVESWSVLQFSDDKAIDPHRFASRELSTYGADGHLDVQAIDRGTDSYDVVICNHVLEHVPDDARAVEELWRVCRPHGFVQIAVPDPPRRATTQDWGYPKASDHDHYRLYGRDVFDLLLAALSSCYVIEVDARDPVTGHVEAAYFVTNADSVAEALIVGGNVRRFRRTA
jgi:SAM-dependent methyltransferase